MTDYVSKYTGAQIDEAVGKALNGGADGEDGADGVGIKSVVQTTTSNADGGTNVITVTKTDNTTSTFTVKNGSKGSKGDKGDTGATGSAGEDGGYYTPIAEQTNATTMRVSFEGSQAGMPAVAPVDVTLPAGVSATHSWNGTVLTITSASGASAADLKGDDGVSPTITASKSGKVTTLTITDATGTKTATINDGEDGTSGDGSASVTADSIKEALGYTPADEADVFEPGEIPAFTNIFDTVGIEYGKLLNTDGSVGDTSAPLCVTDFIPIKAGDVIRVGEDFPLYCVTDSNTPRVTVYDSTYAYLTHMNNTSMIEGGYYIELLEKNADGHIISFCVNKPSTAAYMRICNHADVVGNNPILTINEEIKYVSGYGLALNPKVRVDYSQVMNAPQKNGWSILPYEHLNICYSGINRKPINTVEHFTDAAENFGYNALKCDVRPTSDGELVCCHDAGFTFDTDGYIMKYDASNSTVIHDVTAATCLGYSFATGEHPCLVGDYLDVCRKYGKVAFITIRDEYMDVVIPKLLEELRVHNMTYATIINCMTYASLVQWRQQDTSVMINYTLNFGVAIDQAQIDRAIGLGYCSICGFSLSSASTDPSASCDFEYARANGIRVLEAIAYKEGSPEACYAMGYDGCQIGIPWGSPAGGGVSETAVQTMIDNAIGAAIGGAY